MNAIIQSMKKYEDFRCMKGATQNDISEAEASLNIQFAKDYLEFLTNCGVARCNKHEIIGLGSSDRLNVVSMTKLERSINKKIPSNWYVIEETGMDGIVIWQSQDGKVFQTGPGCEPIQLAESLLEYIQK